MVASIKAYPAVAAIVLGVSEGPDNIVYKDLALRNEIDFIFGNEEDVLQRLIGFCEKASSTDLLRVSSESPFTYFEAIEDPWKDHTASDRDLTALDNLPDGSGFEMIKLEAYKKSWEKGKGKHRSELCSLYIRKHKSEFTLGYVPIANNINRTDIRLIIDYPEDLILCRAVFQKFKHLAYLFQKSLISLMPIQSLKSWFHLLSKKG